MAFKTVTHKMRKRFNHSPNYFCRFVTKGVMIRTKIRFRMQILDEEEADKIE
jgi:hypothetical protein